MEQKSYLKFIYKLHSKRLKKAKWNLSLPLEVAMRDCPEDIVSLNDSQLLRFIDELNGITLCKGCHSELHSIYGYGNNTIEQFREFLYNKYLQTKDLKYLATLEDIDIRKHIMLTNNLSLPI